nr:hypothetical protein [Microbacterium sp.]
MSGLFGARLPQAQVGHRSHQRPRVRMLRFAEHLRCRAVLDDVAVFHHHDVVGHVGHDAHVVRDEDDRRVELGVEVAQQVEDLGLHCHIERRRGLIGDEHTRLQGDGLGDHRTLSLSTGELVRVGVERLERIGHLDQAQELEGPLLRLLPGHPRPVRHERLGDLEADGVDGVQGGHRLLEDRSDPLTADLAQRLGPRTDQLLPGELRAPGHPRVLGEKPHDGHAARALARAGLPDDREDLAGHEVIADVLGGRDPGATYEELDAEIRHRQRRAAGGGGGGVGTARAAAEPASSAGLVRGHRSFSRVRMGACPNRSPCARAAA